MSKTIHLRGLNGLIAIASIAVLISHVSISLKEFGLNKSIFGINSNGSFKIYLLGSHGVSIFFALSGFLITYLLLLEKEKTKNISIKDFYLRRILRIWPLYFAYLILAITFLLIYNISFNKNTIFY